MRIMRLLRSAALALMFAASACNKVGGPPGGAGADTGGMQGPPPVAVIVAPVMELPYAPAIELNGEIRAVQRATLAAEVSGKIVAISHRVGEAHPQGSALIRIDAASYQAAVTASKAELQAAEENLRRLQNGPRPQEIAAQEAGVAAAQAQYDQALDNLKRQQELYKQGVIPESAIVAAQAQADAARAALNAAQQVLDNLRQGSREEDISAAAARVNLAQSALTSAELMLSRTAISPAFDCTMSALFVEVGQYVGPGTPLCEIVADAPGEAWFNLPQQMAAQVQPGAAVEVRVDALPEEVLSGTVISVSSAADAQTRQFPVRVGLNDKRVKPGMAARGRILTAEPKPTLMISDDSQVETKLGLAVYRMVPAGPDDKPFQEGMPPLPSVEQVLVETGDHIDGMVVLTKGDLKPGDMLVTRGKEQLYTSAKIIPTNLMQQSAAGGGSMPGEAPADGAAAAGKDAQAPPAVGAGSKPPAEQQPPTKADTPEGEGNPDSGQAGGDR